MPISRSMMERQLRMGGGIMDVVPREPAILGGLKKAVKGVAKGITGAIKGVTKSPLGMAALALSFPQVRAGLSNFFGPGSFNPLKMMMTTGPNPGSLVSSPFARFLGTDLGKATVIGGASILGGLSADAQKDVNQLKKSGDQGLVKRYLKRYYENVNPEASEEEVQEFLRVNSSMGGRIGYSNGSEDYEKRFMKLVAELREAGFTQEQAIEEARERLNRADGGRIGYAMGDTAEDNAIQASGVMGLPLNKNPAGVTELDLRETGGFIPPVGVKEKADDIPAMLSNNEFVFTADAVRGMGDGDVNKGAERMYNMMKKLENGGRV